jgi:hypothetical protein
VPKRTQASPPIFAIQHLQFQPIRLNGKWNGQKNEEALPDRVFHLFMFERHSEVSLRTDQIAATPQIQCGLRRLATDLPDFIISRTVCLPSKITR